MEGPHGPAAHDRWDGSRTNAVEPDDLLLELCARAGESSRPQQHVGALFDAVLAVTSGLDLSEVLTRVVEGACELVGARYGALGVIGSSGDDLVQFVTHGLTGAERDGIGSLPRGHGVLGQVIRDPRPLRLDCLADHPASQGFPSGHPAMDSFLGAPVRVGEEVFGNLYLTEKMGAPGFTAEDEEIVVALAGAAGIAIENARLHERTAGQRQVMETGGRVSQLLLEGRGETEAMTYLAGRVRALSRATAAVVALHDDDGELVVRAVDREAGRAQAPGKSLADVGSVLDDGVEGWLSEGCVSLRVPITLHDNAIGTIVVTWQQGFDSVVGDTDDLIGTLGHQVALALTAARSQHARARVTLLEDRERIARDMHDHVIQRLFATGLSLQAASRMSVTDAVGARLDDAVEALDEAIKDIRHTIFGLHRETDPADLHAELVDLVHAARDGLGFLPRLSVTGTLSRLPADLEADVVAVVREALANVSRHARATGVVVSVAVAASVTITVSDDGVGIDPDASFSGLANLRARAEGHGGALRLDANVPRGAVLTWMARMPGAGAS